MKDFGLNDEAGLALWQEETYGDWYRDPWDWPEYWWLRKNIGEIDFEEYYDPSTRRLRLAPVFHLMDVPKTHLGVRPAVIQDPISRFLYLTATASAMPRIHSDLPDFVFGWRHRQEESSTDALTDESDEAQEEWDRYISHVRRGDSSPSGLQADLTSFFASIETDNLIVRLRERLGASAAYSIISHVIEEHNKSSRRSGLSQRSFASAALANFFLQRLDQTLASHLRLGRVDRVARWMDDIVAFGHEEELYSLYVEIQEVVRTLSLELNSSKGRLGTAQEAINAIVLEQIDDIKVRSKVVQNEYTGRESKVLDVEDMELLNSLEEFALTQGPNGTRPWIRAALSSLTVNESFARQEAWRDNAKNIPHVADSLGRYLRGAAKAEEKKGSKPILRPLGENPLTWEGLCEWLVAHLKSPWCRIDWVKAQLSLAVPSRKTCPELAELYRDWFANSNSAQLLAVSGQRLARIDPTFCWETVRSRFDDVRDPLIERVFSLVTLDTGLDMPLAKQIARKSEVNKLLVRALDDMDWKSPKISRDFDDRSSRS
ncbi:reverse transcriptase domain-containing protein [Prauserella sp. PE36]|uniref:reverse transcriptase domain-containing protein n=1 Tax=Prauserella sp. PE36 TaxID=1504709 RepID=UPI0013141949|nr:reverse transcriptase domain-containing protein [Prauserella sp. PE36]